MKIALINGSPKMKNSASGCILQDLKPFLDKNNNIIYECCFRETQVTETQIKQLKECDVLVFAFPLYVDAIPSHLLRCLIQLERYFETIDKKNITVYCLVNCGFYEGEHNKLAIEIMENWCYKLGLKWGQGVGIGAGGMLSSLKNVPIGKGPKKNLEKAFISISNNILKCTSQENIFITANFSRLLYKLAAERGWRMVAKANGLSAEDLSLRK